MAKAKDRFKVEAKIEGARTAGGSQAPQQHKRTLPEGYADLASATAAASKAVGTRAVYQDYQKPNGKHPNGVEERTGRVLTAAAVEA